MREMPRLLVLLVLLLTIATSARANGTRNFTGTWVYNGDDSIVFSLDLKQTGNRIEGYHTAVTRHGRRIDAVMPNEGHPSITGTVSDGVGHVRFQSGYSDATGEAVITMHGNKLAWRITKSSGTHYLPVSSGLYRHPLP